MNNNEVDKAAEELAQQSNVSTPWNELTETQKSFWREKATKKAGPSRVVNRQLTDVRQKRKGGRSAATLIEKEPTYEELKKRIADLERKKPSGKGLEFRVSEKGGVSAYGLGRFPVTLYYEQWHQLLDVASALREFLEKNKGKLKIKE